MPLPVAIPALIAIAKKLFRGADPAQVPAAQIEQAFEAAANNLYYVAQAGMISKEQAAAGMQVFLQQGIEYEGKANLGAAAQKGAANMTKVIQAEITGVMSLGAISAVPLDLAKARTLYQTGSGWYAASLQTAAQLTDAYLGSLTSGLAATLASLAGSPVKLGAVGLGVFVLVSLWQHFRPSK
jgi:hypothetical protein